MIARWKPVHLGHAAVLALEFLMLRQVNRADAVPQALTDYIKGRQGYDYNEHGQAGNTHTQFVPDEIVRRFCVLGTPQEHVDKLAELAGLGMTQFGLYLQHDGKDETLHAYGNHVIPAIAGHARTKTD